MANMKVTPTRIMKRLKGKPATTLFGPHVHEDGPHDDREAMLSKPT